MCRLIYYELAKIWRKRSLALSVCVLLILNLFLLWYVNCSNGENVPLSAYKSFQNEIAEMSEIEKGDYISNLKETMDGVCLVQNVLDMQKMQGESGKALAEQEMTANPGVFEKYYKTYQSGSYLHFTDSIWQEKNLIDELYNEQQKAAGYEEYLQSVQGNKASLSGISIFGNQDKNNFSTRNIEKSAEDYAALSDQNIRWMPSKALSVSMENIWTDLFLILSVFLFAGNLIFEEKEKKLFYITRSTKRGQFQSICAKLTALLIHCIAIAALLYGCNLIFSEVTIGFEDVTASIQSISQAMSVMQAQLLIVGNIVANALTVDKADIRYAQIEDLDVVKENVETLVADNATINSKLTANEASINSLVAKDAEIDGKLTAQDASIKKLDAEKLSAEDANLTYATIESLKATDATIANISGDYASFKDTTTETLKAQTADIVDLKANKLSATDADFRYANIDFTNIGKAAMEYFYAQSGLIKDVTVGDQTITGELVGVTIKGDLIEGNTIVADKLVIKGDDGLYYKLNTDGSTVEKEQTDYNSLKGSLIQAKSITAEKISVNDLVAFDATIAGFSITDSALYSGAKASATNGTRGIYLGKDGQVSFGDDQNYIMYFKDTDGSWKLAISANSITFSSGRNIEDVISSMQDRMDEIADEVTTSLYVTSSKGNVFKNTNVSTILSVTIIRGTQRITDSETLALVFGEGAFLQWRYQLNDSDDYLTLAPEDQRIAEGGFKFKISPDDIDTKGVYACDLIVEEKEKNQNGN